MTRLPDATSLSPTFNETLLSYTEHKSTISPYSMLLSSPSGTLTLSNSADIST